MPRRPPSSRSRSRKTSATAATIDADAVVDRTTDPSNTEMPMTMDRLRRMWTSAYENYGSMSYGDGTVAALDRMAPYTLINRAKIPIAVFRGDEEFIGMCLFAPDHVHALLRRIDMLETALQECRFHTVVHPNAGAAQRVIDFVLADTSFLQDPTL
jgi:hypothetical protein